MKDRKLTRKELARLEELHSIEAARVMVKDLWTSACQYDEIDPAATNVVFSPGNPYVERYQVAIGNLQALMTRNTIRLV